MALEGEEKTKGAASSFPILSRRSPKRARSIIRSIQVPAMKAASSFPLDLKAGDLVLFGKWSGTEVKIDGQDHF